MSRSIQWKTESGVIFTAYPVREGHWVGSRQAPGEPEQFLKSYPSADSIEAIYRRESKQQRTLFQPVRSADGFDCFQDAGECLPGQLALFEARGGP